MGFLVGSEGSTLFPEALSVLLKRDCGLQTTEGRAEGRPGRCSQAAPSPRFAAVPCGTPRAVQDVEQAGSLEDGQTLVIQTRASMRPGSPDERRSGTLSLQPAGGA